MLLFAPMSLEECLERVRSGPVPQNEESAKIQLILPVLRSLDWDDTDANEVRFEHSVGGKKGGRVDIALRSGGRVVALIEAKAPREDLTGHIEQVLGYAYHEGVDICVLTTGLEWRLFLPRERGKPLSRQFAVLDLKNDSVERLAEDLNAFLRKETLESGKAETKAKLVLKASLEAARLEKEIPKIWKTMLDEPDEELVELIGSRVYEKLNLRPEKDQVIAALRGKPVPMVSKPDVPVPKAPPANEVQKQGRRLSRKPVAIVLWGTRYQVRLHKEVLIQVVDCLFERHVDEFHRTLEPMGGKGPYVALDPAGFSSSRYNNAHRVRSSRYFVNTHGSAETVRKRAEYFLECFGHDKTDLEILFE